MDNQPQRRQRNKKPFGALLTTPNTDEQTQQLSCFRAGQHQKNKTNKQTAVSKDPTSSIPPPIKDDKDETTSLIPTPRIDSTEEIDTGDTCLICAESVKCYALGACSHRTCHVCSLRMRALYKKRDCVFCKTELPQVVFTADAQAPFNSYNLTTLEFKDPHLSVYCETFEQLEELLAYLKFNCPLPDCSSVLNNWRDLKFHTRSCHGLVLCDLCCSNTKIFAHEHTLFTPKGLIQHMNQGSVGVGKGIRSLGFKAQAKDNQQVPEDGFTGHPRCDFCSTHFYDDDQLYKHCREKHEQCFICVRNELDRWRYYLDYKHLESHFRQDHYLCPQSACLEARFVVFETALDLQAHQIEAHGAEMGIRATRDARKLETNFVYSGGKESHSQETERSGREHRAGRGIRVMDITPVRAEGPSVLSNANRIVPGLGPSSERSGDRKADKGKSKSTSIEERDAGHPLQSSSSDVNDINPRSSSDLELQRHAALMQRVSRAVNDVDAKVTSFKVAVRTYRNNEMAASDFLDTICNIFDHRRETIGSILSNVLDLLDIEDERKGQLLEKWLDLKLDKSQYPSLGGNAHSSQMGHDPNELQLLSASSWVRQNPQYSKMIEKSARNSNQPEVPAMAPKGAKNGNQRVTAWASGSSNPSLAPVRPVNAGSTKPSASRPAPMITASLPSVLATGRAVHTQFPSLPTNPAARPSWKPAAATRAEPAKPPGQWVPEPAPLHPTPGASKKPKKIVLFTNSR